MLEVRHFEIVDAIARAGSVTSAAGRLHLSQPAVSHALADLESRLGVRLFHREPRGMRITAEGERLLEAGRVVLPAVRQAEADLRGFRDGRRGTLRLSTECYTCYHWLPAVLAHFRDRWPDVDVEIVPEATDDPVSALAEERLDLAVLHSRPGDPDLVSEELFDDELVAAVLPGHPLAGRAWLEPGDLRDETLLLHSNPERSTVVLEFLEPAGVRPARVLTLRLTEAVLAAVEAGLGITVMARWALAPLLEEGRLVALGLGEGGLWRSWRLATRRDRADREPIQDLARLLKEEGAVGPVGAAVPDDPGEAGAR